MHDIYIDDSQRKLSIGEVTTKPFDFETMCVMNDALSEKAGIIRAGFEGVKYMFCETSVSSKTIDALSVSEKASLSEAVTDWYYKDIIAARKNK